MEAPLECVLSFSFDTGNKCYDQLYQRIKPLLNPDHHGYLRWTDWLAVYGYTVRIAVHSNSARDLTAIDVEAKFTPEELESINDSVILGDIAYSVIRAINEWDGDGFNFGRSAPLALLFSPSVSVYHCLPPKGGLQWNVEKNVPLHSFQFIPICHGMYSYSPVGAYSYHYSVSCAPGSDMCPPNCLLVKRMIPASGNLASVDSCVELLFIFDEWQRTAEKFTKEYFDAAALFDGIASLSMEGKHVTFQ